MKTQKLKRKACLINSTKIRKRTKTITKDEIMRHLVLRNPGLDLTGCELLDIQDLQPRPANEVCYRPLVFLLKESTMEWLKNRRGQVFFDIEQIRFLWPEIPCPTNIVNNESCQHTHILQQQYLNRRKISVLIVTKEDLKNMDEKKFIDSLTTVLTRYIDSNSKNHEEKRFIRSAITSNIYMEYSQVPPKWQQCWTGPINVKHLSAQNVSF